MVLRKYFKTQGYYAAILIIALLIVDRITKIWAATLTKEINVWFFSFNFASNTGAGFSILTGNNSLLIWLSIIILGILIYYFKEFPKSAIYLIIAGLIGNLIDRILYGYVTDFVDFKFFPVFNLSDAMITIGVVIALIYFIRNDLRKHDPKKISIQQGISAGKKRKAISSKKHK